jgi:hypothetical protein
MSCCVVCGRQTDEGHSELLPSLNGVYGLFYCWHCLDLRRQRSETDRCITLEPSTRWAN